MIIKTDFDIGQIVYLRTDVEQHERLIIGFEVAMGGMIKYLLGFGTDYSWHFAGELTVNKDILKTLNADGN